VIIISPTVQKKILHTHTQSWFVWGWKIFRDFAAKQQDELLLLLVACVCVCASI